MLNHNIEIDVIAILYHDFLFGLIAISLHTTEKQSGIPWGSQPSEEHQEGRTSPRQDRGMRPLHAGIGVEAAVYGRNCARNIARGVRGIPDTGPHKVLRSFPGRPMGYAV